MKYLSCLLLESGLALDRFNNIKPCIPGHTIHWIENYNGEPFNVEQYLENKNKYIQMMKNGNIPEQCIGCSNLEEKDWNEQPGIEFISIGNKTKCSCKCYYCVFADEKDYFNNCKSYNFMPFLQSLAEKKLLRNTTIDITGGECTEYPQELLKGLIDFALDNQLWLHFFSSGIFYSEDIAKAMHKSRANIIVSVDSGTKKIYERIKRIKTFDKVWENMEKYATVGVQDNIVHKGYVILKYIIIPGLNDNMEEITTFVEKAKQSGCKWLRFAVEYNWWNENNEKPMPENLWKILDFCEECKKDFKVDYIENAIYLWKKRTQEDKNFKGLNPCENITGC